MKRFHALTLLIIIVNLTGCSSSKEIEGSWETSSLIKDGTEIQTIYSDITFYSADRKIKAKGMAGVNLFHADVKTKGNKINIYDMENTGFYGTYSEMEFEDMFFSILMNADHYKTENDRLILYSASEEMELQLKKKKDTVIH